MTSASNECQEYREPIGTNGSKRDQDIEEPVTACHYLDLITAMSSSDMAKFFAEKEVQKALNMVQTKGDNKSQAEPTAEAELDSKVERQIAEFNPDQKPESQNLQGSAAHERQNGAPAQASRERQNGAPALASRERQNGAPAGLQGNFFSQSLPQWQELDETVKLAVSDIHNVVNCFQMNTVAIFGEDMVLCVLNHVFLPIWMVLFSLGQLCCELFSFFCWAHYVGATALCGFVVLHLEAGLYICSRSQFEKTCCKIIDQITVTFCSAPDRVNPIQRLIAYEGKIFVETDKTTNLDVQKIYVLKTP